MNRELLELWRVGMETMPAAVVQRMQSMFEFLRENRREWHLLRDLFQHADADTSAQVDAGLIATTDRTRGSSNEKTTH